MDPEPGHFLQIFLLAQGTTTAMGMAVIGVLLFLTAMVSAAEVALFSLTPKDIDACMQQDPRNTRIIKTLLGKPKKLLATIVVANNFVNIGVVILFSVAGNALLERIEIPWLKFLVDVVVVTFFILLFGEVLPKVYASRNNMRFALFVARPLYILDILLSPISIPLRGISNFLHRKLGKQKTNFSVDHLSQALELTSSEGTSHHEQKILEGIVSFGNTDTRQVMSPRIDIFALEIDEDFPDVMRKIMDAGFSRIPVYRDNIDQIEGVLFVKDLIPYINAQDFDWKTLLRDPFFVPENKKLDDLLKDFQAMKSHLAIVVDEYGGTSGLVSLEDVIEEIVGDISDEFDVEGLNYSQIDEHTFVFEGKISMKDFYRITNADEALFESKKGEAETLAGFILEIFGNFPRKGQNINFDRYRFTVESVDKRRIRQVKVKIE